MRDKFIPRQVQNLKKSQHNAERRSEQSRGILKIADVLNDDNESTTDKMFTTTRTPRTLELRALHMLRLKLIGMGLALKSQVVF